MTKRRAALPVISSLAFASLLAASPARAQATGFSVNRFDPAERGSEWFTTDSLDLRGRGRFALGVTGDYAYRPVVIRETGNPDVIIASTVRHQFFTHIGGSLVLFDRLRFGVNMPIVLYQAGRIGTQDTPPPPVTLAPPSDRQAIGDLRLGTDVRLVGEYRSPISIAFGVQVYLPTGSRDQYTGDGTVRVHPRLLAAGEAGPFVYAARTGVHIRPYNGDYRTTTLGSEWTAGASAGIRTADGNLVFGPELSFATLLNDAAFRSRGTQLEGLMGGHYTAGNVRFGVGAGGGFLRSYGTPSSRVVASIEWVQPLPPPPPPPAPTDRDRDGIVDGVDACPNEPGVHTTDPKTDGCPLPPPDRDGDGVPDASDACPDQAGVATSEAATNGCPPDRDKDGIRDQLDACPDQPGQPDVDPKKNGCPPDPDRDKDGVPNDQDACPDEPGTPDTDPKKNGCPKAFVQNGQIRIIDQVKFKTGSAEILKGKDSEAVLVAVRDVLEKHPEIRKLRVEGHTDNVGNAAHNLALSKRRAESVVKWLTTHGVDKTRLASTGFGPERPILDNTSDSGRAANRRVEFHIE